MEHNRLLVATIADLLRTGTPPGGYAMSTERKLLAITNSLRSYWWLTEWEYARFDKLASTPQKTGS